MYLDDIDIPKPWKNLSLDQLKGIVMIVGGSNSGKTTFTRYVYTEMLKSGREIAYLDGDPGQSTLGPPTTMTIGYVSPRDAIIDKRYKWRKFVGSISPKGHMLQTLVGAKRLVEVVESNGVKNIVYDTTGLIDPQQGGLALKIAKIDLLCPKTIIAFQRDNELSQLLYPLRRMKHINVVVLEPSNQIIVRDKLARQEHRRRKYQEYFENAQEVDLNWTNITVLPAPRFAINRLIALQNRLGFVDALGIITAISRDKNVIRLKSPKYSPENLSSLHLGDILVNPLTYEDRYI